MQWQLLKVWKKKGRGGLRFARAGMNLGPVCDGTKEAMWTHFTKDSPSPRLCCPAQRGSASLSEWRPKDSLVYRLYFSYYHLVSARRRVNMGSRSNSELSLRTAQRRLRPRPFAVSAWIDAFSFRKSVYTQVRRFWRAALRVFLFSSKHGMGFFCQGRRRAPADVLALWIIRVCHFRRQACLGFQNAVECCSDLKLGGEKHNLFINFANLSIRKEIWRGESKAAKR